jgi:hypothetical protein
MTRFKEGAHGGTMGSPVLGNEWGHSCRLVDLVERLL